MKPKYKLIRFQKSTLSLSASIVICLSSGAMAQTANNWTGTTSSDWNTASNWSAGVLPTKVANYHAVINTSTPNIASITVGIIPPVDLIVGLGAGSNGRLDHVSGDGSTGSGNWMYVGTGGGTGVYNLANTGVTGAGVSGYGQGSGSMTTNGGRFYVAGWNSAGSTGTVNINTTGTLTVGSEFNISGAISDSNSTGGGTAVVNLESGAITTNDWTRVGGGSGSNGTLNMTGGSITKNGNNNFVIGGTGSTGVANVSGGTITVNNEFWVANSGGSKGTLNLSGGTITNNSWASIGRSGATLGKVVMTGGTWNKTGGGNFLVGDGSPGQLDLSGGAINVNGEFWVGQGGGANGTLNLSSGGTIANNSWVAVGRSGGTGTVNMTGGTWTKTGNGSSFIVGSSGPGTFNHSAGLVDVQQGDTWMGEGGTANYTLSGSGEFRATYFQVARNGGSTGNVNLNGGTLYVNQIAGGGGTSTVSFNGTQIIAKTAGTSFISGLTSATIGTGKLKVDSAGFNLTAPQLLGGTGGLVKSGAGTLTLTAANSYSGATSVNDGKLAVTTASTANGVVTLADYTALGITQTALNQATTVTGATFGSADTTTLDLDFGSFAGNSTNAPLNVSGSGALTVNGVVTVNVTDNLPVVGTIPLVSYTGGKAGSGSFALGTLPDGVVASFSDNGTNLVSLNVTRVNDAYWTGAVDTNWDTSTANWKDDYAETASVYQDGDPVMFDDRVVATGPAISVTLNTTVAPGGSGVTFANATKNYTLAGTGKITGTTGLLKQGAGTATLNTTNDYTGATKLNGGTLSLATLTNGGTPSPIGAATSDSANIVFSGGTLSYTGGDVAIDRGFTISGANSGISTASNLTFSGDVFSTGGSLVKTGAGNLTLTNPSVVVGGGGQINKITGGTLTFDGSGSQFVSVPGELWVGSIPDTSGNLVLNDTILTVGSWITVGRGTGNTGVTCTLTATNSTIQCNQLSTGFDADLGYNSATQLISLTNTSFSNSGRTALSEKQNDTTTMTLSGTSSFTSPYQFQMALNATAVANLILQDDATMTLTGNWLSIGNDGTGTCTVKNNASLSKTGGDFNISDVGTSNGTLNIQDNATVSANGVVFVGKNNGTTGTVNMDGGTFNTNTYITIGRGAGSVGVFNMNGGTINQTDPNAGLAVGEQGNGTFNFNGGSINVGGGGFYITTEVTTTGVGVANLNGGTLTAKRVTARDGTSGTSTLNFNGSVLKADSGASSDFISNLDNVFVKSGGAKIDSNGQNIAIGQPLLDGTGGGGLVKTGAGTLSLNAVNTYTGTTTVNAGTLGGTGTVAGPLVVSAAGTIAPGASAGTFTAGATTISGTYACEIDGTGCDKLVANGTLNVSAATLAITQLNPASGPLLVIASYTGSTPAPFASVSGVPAGYALDYSYGGNSIALVQTATPYTSWINGFTSIPLADRDPGDDPDGDGETNLAEFALNGNPASGTASGKVVGKVASVGGSPALVLTLPVRTGATFSGSTEQVSALIDGVIYHIQGSDQLSTWNLAVSEVLGADKTAIETGLPALDSGWTYRSFQSPGSTSGDPADFLRAVIVSP